MSLIMAQYKYLVSRTLTAEIWIEAENVKESREKVQEKVEGMSNRDFDDVEEESANLLEFPEGEEISEKDAGIFIF